MFPFAEPEIWSAEARERKGRILPTLKRYVHLWTFAADAESSLSRGTGGRV